MQRQGSNSGVAPNPYNTSPRVNPAALSKSIGGSASAKPPMPPSAVVGVAGGPSSSPSLGYSHTSPVIAPRPAPLTPHSNHHGYSSVANSIPSFPPVPDAATGMQNMPPSPHLRQMAPNYGQTFGGGPYSAANPQGVPSIYGSSPVVLASSGGHEAAVAQQQQQQRNGPPTARSNPNATLKRMNSPTSGPRSPSRYMRVSYAEPWNAAAGVVSMGSGTAVGANGGAPTTPGRPVVPNTHPGQALRSISRVPQSARTAEVTNASSSCLSMFCPGCKLLSIVTFTSVLQLATMIAFHVWFKLDSKMTFDWFLDATSLVGNRVINDNQYYRVLSALFVHATWPQLVVNLFMQQQLGNILGSRFDSCLWLRVWLFCGIFGSIFGSIAQPTVPFVAVTAANLGPAGFHLSEVLLIMPQLQTADLRKKALISVIIALVQVAILSCFSRTSALANLVAFSLGICIGIVYHRKGADLPKWYGQARGFAIFFVVVLVVAAAIRFCLRRFYHV